MIYSLKRYFRLFSITLILKKEKLILFNHFISYFFTKTFIHPSYSKKDKQISLNLSVRWLLSAHQEMKDGGFGTFYIVDNWTSSYPETSGYIIPTLFEAIPHCRESKAEIVKTILYCADWLSDIQKPSGGWQAYYVSHDKPEVVFNTGQVIRGLVIVHHLTQNDRFKESIQKSCDWLVSVQEENGSWVKMASMNQPRVYDAYVAHPLLLGYKITGNEAHKIAAIKSLDWVLSQQEENGWFNNADNTIKHNHQPILHTIAYTIDGLINCGIILNEKKYIEAGKKAADKLLDLFNEHGYLNGRFDKNWTPTDYMICTGCAQISIIWSMLYEITKENKYLDAVKKINSQLTNIQRSCLTINGSGNGAIPGSFPLWGKYEPFGFPNWATKYFADAIMYELNISSKFD